jgi:hypothetical protein
MIDREVARSASPDQFLWFSEDDYLYRPDALRLLTAGLASLPDADYVTMYGSRALDVAASGPRAVSFDPGGAEGDPAAAITVDGVQWYRGFASTSTYGTRLGTLREDRRLLALCSISGGPWDRTTSQALAGYRPFTLSEIRQDVLPSGSVGLSDRGKGLARGAMRVAVTARSLRRQSRRRTLFAADPELISHMEVHDSTTRTVPSAQSAATDWAAIAAETVSWAQGRGIAVSSPVSK